MQSLFAKLVIGLSITAIGIFAADNSLGTWKRNIDKSTGSGPRTVKSLTTVREASDGGVKVTSTGENMDGTPITISYTEKYDCIDIQLIGATSTTLSIN